MKHRIALADDHEIVLDGLRRILQPEFEIVATTADGEELVVALREALAGRTYITPRIANEVLQNLMSHPGETAGDGSGLTSREREVLQLLAEGKIIKEIAGILNISPRTVEFHKNNLVVKTGLRTTAELARYASRLGLVSEAG